MINKKIYFTDKEEFNILKGLNKLVNAVSSTLGPTGKSVIIENDINKYQVTKDGVTVAKSIKVENKLENAVIQIVKEVAQKTSDEVGDGTTTSAILAGSMIEQFIKTRKFFENIHSDSLNSSLIKDGINEAIENVKVEIEKHKKEIKDLKDIENIALISSNRDKEVSQMIAKAFDKIGWDGIITAEKSRSSKTELDIVDGLKFDRGYLSPYFVNNKSQMSVELKDCKILLYDGSLNSTEKSFISLLESVISKKDNLLIIAENIGNAALAMLIVNKARGTLNSCAIKSPEFGKKRELLMEDLAALTGGTVITKKRGLSLKNMKYEMLGSAKNIIVKNHSTTIIGGNNDKKIFEERLDEIKNAMDSAENIKEKEFHQLRLNKLTSGVAIINVGGDTETEVNERKDRVEDAIYATKAAIDNGIIPGGGILLKRIGYEAINSMVGKNDQEVGKRIVYEAIQEAFNIIVKNSGEDPKIIWSEIKDKSNYSYGYDANLNQITDLLESGIVDPTKVVLTALDKAKSIANIFISSNCIIVSDEKEEKNIKPDMDMTSIY